ncbi:hypothetical protein IHE61_20855 [Streptomyces sp. GKU 257-1]|nr:hypothetical protein [Streptomyces sp. GKU 257-1]
MDIDTINGLPAHPLLVHGAVTLVPLAALRCCWCCVRCGPPWEGGSAGSCLLWPWWRSWPCC